MSVIYDEIKRWETPIFAQVVEDLGLPTTMQEDDE